ncbi:hypothetical protein B0H14DRAFT_3522057 [Mycena olivaceomarginata]|nr:hypothetical protein B0H14DRAFT_3522057 [Mycena olivaceomarginata]
MANAETLAAARQRRSQRVAKSGAQSVAVPALGSIKSPSPVSPVSSFIEKPLHFSESPTPMEPSSDDGLPISIPLITTRSNTKCKSGYELLLDDASDVVDKPAKKKRHAPEPTSQDDSDTEEVPPKKKKPGLKPKPKPKAAPKAKASTRRKKKVPTSDSESMEVADKEKPKPAAPPIVLMVPEATSDGSQRLSIQSPMSFEDALELIHETIGCVGVACKPTLGYKLLTANQKSATINLRTENDWSGLITDVMAKAKTKTDVSVLVSVFPDNYMLSLRAITKKKPTASKKKGKTTIMDLNNDESADENDAGVEDGEKKAMAELDAEYRKCLRKNRVTKTTPPEGDLFSMFHRKAKDGPTPGSAGPLGLGQYNPYYPYPMPPLFGGPPPGFPSYHPHLPPAQQLPSESAIHPMLSSDPPDDDVAYPSIIDFIAGLIRVVPGREGLRAVGETLDSLHYFQIDEIVSLTVDDLGTVRFGTVVPGDATYLLEKVRREVKRLDKLARCSCHS